MSFLDVYRTYKNELIIFIGFIFIRAIPEIISYPYPIGYDSAYYIGTLHRYGQLDFLSYLNRIIFQEFKQPPFLFVIYYILLRIGINEIAIIKATTPIFYGILGISIYKLYLQELSSNRQEALFTTLIVGLYYTTLRIGTDYIKNLLALAFFILALYYHEKPRKNNKSVVLYIIFSVLTFITHQLMTFFLSILLWFLVLIRFKQQRLKSTLIDIFILSIGGFFSLFYMLHSFTLEALLSMNISTPTFIYIPYHSYGDLMIFVISLLILCTLPILSLLAIIIYQNESSIVKKSMLASKVILLWILISFFFGISPLLVYPLKVPFWYRWIMLLPIPLLFVTMKILVFTRHLRIKPFRVSIYLKVALVFTLMASFGYMTFPSSAPYFFFTSPTTNEFFPTTMQKNTVLFEQMNDLERIFTIANEIIKNRTGKIAFIAPEPLYGWALYYLDRDIPVIICSWNVTEAIERGIREGYQEFFMVWWKKSIYVKAINSSSFEDKLIIPSGFTILKDSEFFLLYYYHKTTIKAYNMFGLWNTNSFLTIQLDELIARYE